MIVIGLRSATRTLCLATILGDIPCRVAYETDLGHSDGVTSEVSDVAVCKGAELVAQVKATGVDAVYVTDLRGKLLHPRDGHPLADRLHPRLQLWCIRHER